MENTETDPAPVLDGRVTKQKC